MDKRAIGSPQETENLLKIYSYYRVGLGAILTLMYAFGVAREVLGVTGGLLFLITSVSYLTLAVILHLALRHRDDSPNQAQMFTLFLVDLIAIGLLTYSSGGVNSGLGYLSLITIASASIVLSAQLAYLLAALTTIYFLLKTSLQAYSQSYSIQDVFSAGVLGILLFTAATLFLYLSRRIRVTQTEAALRGAEAAELQTLNENIIRGMRTGIVVVDQAKKIKLINSAAIQLLGGTKTQPLLKPGSTLSVVPELRDQFERWATYPWLRTPTFQVDQSATQLQANFTQLKTAEAESTLIFIEDTRSLSQHAQQLKLSSLGRLTGSIAHEIRNPLGAISHAAQLLQDAEDPEQTQKLVDIIYRHSERVNQIVDDILKLSSQDQPAFQKVWLQQWLKKFSDDYLEGADDGGVIDTTHLNGEFQVTFDTRHLSRIITNLLDNAFKYSRRATGSAWAKLVTGVDDSEMPFLEIHDRGEGVPEENIDKIFEPFFTTTHEGSGLGLYISRELCTNNFATLSYVQADDSSHYFRLGFAHPDQLLPRTH